ncbi:MAG TPA: helix-turn-helix transcriptional regulator [Candidatus Limnocylindrales bacterium]|nr:helix-turn-helix transcriptional regulator [Candidatus Limnocylindrales bacterium]
MPKVNTQFPNRVQLFRHKRCLQTEQVAHLLGHQTTSTLEAYERAARLPSFLNALRLSIILRTPVEFLYGQLYDYLREAIRAEEERLNAPEQQVLF